MTRHVYQWKWYLFIKMNMNTWMLSAQATNDCCLRLNSLAPVGLRRSRRRKQQLLQQFLGQKMLLTQICTVQIEPAMFSHQFTAGLKHVQMLQIHLPDWGLIYLFVPSSSLKTFWRYVFEKHLANFALWSFLLLKIYVFLRRWKTGFY